MNDDFNIISVEDRRIVVAGLGKMFYQEGQPIGILASHIEKCGLEVSWIHIVKELLDHGWKEKTILSKLSDELLGEPEKIEIVSKFLQGNGGIRQKMIFDYLFVSEENAKKWFRSIMVPK